MEENVPAGSICCFCQTSDNDEAMYGKFYKYKNIISHYFCLLLASKVLQRGSDEDGILGFLPEDITNEVKRGKISTCTFCGKRGATIACCYSKCKVQFHLPCGRKRDTFHQFFGQFKSYCSRHRLKQKINSQVLKAMSGKESVNCVICLESVSATPAPNTLWAPCCSKEAWFHRLCVQRLALSAGYFFKCPLCNNTKQFVEAMRTYGIWVPEQDASWEAEPERYSSLLERHNSCDAKSCRCKQGRTFHLDNTKWDIKLCIDCGSQGMHVQCGNLRLTDEWVCPICSSVTVQKEKLVKRKNGLPERQSTQNASRRTNRRPQRVIRRVTTRQSQPPLLEEEDEKGEDEEVDVIGNKDENESGERNNDEKQQMLPENRTTSSPSPPQPPPSDEPFSKKKVLEPHSRPRMNRRRTRSDRRSPSPTVAPSLHEEAPTTAKMKSDFEVIDIDDNSDDDIQILYTPNIKFIKTNEGVSVPVVKVPASSAPSWDGVVASGEPCQSSVQLIPTFDLEDDSVLDTAHDGCQPSTSHASDSLEQPLGSMTEVLVSGEPPQSDDDDIEVVEVSNPQISVSMLKQKLVDTSTQLQSLQTDLSDNILNIRIENVRSDASHETADFVYASDSSLSVANSSSLSVPDNQKTLDGSHVHSRAPCNTFQGSPNPFLSATSTTESSLPLCRPSVIQNVSSYINKVRSQTGGPNCFPTNSIPLQNCAPTSTTWMGAPPHPVAISGSGPSQGLAGKPLAPLSSNTNVTMVHSTIALPPSILPAGTHAMFSSSIPFIRNSPMPTQNIGNHFPSHSLSTSNPVYVSHPMTATTHQATVSNNMRVNINCNENITTHQATLSNNMRVNVNCNENITNSLENSVPQVLPRVRQSSNLLDSLPPQRQVYQLPNRAVQDDWSYSVQVVPRSNESGRGNLHTHNPEDSPEVILERNPGPVPCETSLWSQTEGVSCSLLPAVSSREDNITAATLDDQSQIMNGTRERKQKLVERRDFNQVRLFPPALMQFCPGSCQQSILLHKRFYSKGCHLN